MLVNSEVVIQKAIEQYVSSEHINIWLSKYRIINLNKQQSLEVSYKNWCSRDILLIILQHFTTSVVRSRKILTFVSSSDKCPWYYILWKCFSHTFNENVEIFLSKGRTNDTHFRIDTCGGMLYSFQYLISIRVWGIVSLILLSVIPQPSLG